MKLALEFYWFSRNWLQYYANFNVSFLMALIYLFFLIKSRQIYFLRMVVKLKLQAWSTHKSILKVDLHRQRMVLMDIGIEGVHVTQAIVSILIISSFSFLFLTVNSHRLTSIIKIFPKTYVHSLRWIERRIVRLNISDPISAGDVLTDK